MGRISFHERRRNEPLGKMLNDILPCSPLCPHKYRPDPPPSETRKKNVSSLNLREVRAGSKCSQVRRCMSRELGQRPLHYGCNCNDFLFLNANFEVYFQGIILLSINTTDHTVDKLSAFQWRNWPVSTLGAY